MASSSGTPASPIQEAEGWWRMLPPLAAAFKALRAPNPLNAIQNVSIANIFWAFLALLAIMVAEIIVIIAGANAPFVDPITQLWNYNFKLYWDSELDWKNLLVCVWYTLGACSSALVVSAFFGYRLGGSASEKKKSTLLGIYCALGTAFICLMVTLSIYGISWIFHLLNLYIFTLLWLPLAVLAVVPFATIWLRRVFARAGLVASKLRLAAFAISIVTSIVGVSAGIQIEAHLNSSLLDHGRQVNKARSSPTPAILQMCTVNDKDVVCAITLFPAKWQGYELIGAWSMSKKIDQDPQDAGNRWLPSLGDDHALPIVSMDGGKDITVELHMPLNKACGPQGSLITNDERYFFVNGRVRGLHQSPQRMRISLDTSGSGLGDMVGDECGKSGP